MLCGETFSHRSCGELLTRTARELVLRLGKDLAFIGAIGVAIASCAPRPSVIEPSPNGAVIRGARTGQYTKEVMAKKDPDTLLAADGTFCRVPADRYRDTAVHSMVYCNWQ